MLWRCALRNFPGKRSQDGREGGIWVWRDKGLVLSSPHGRPTGRAGLHVYVSTPAMMRQYVYLGAEIEKSAIKGYVTPTTVVADVEDIGGRVAGFGRGRLECAEYALGVFFCTS